MARPNVINLLAVHLGWVGVVIIFYYSERSTNQIEQRYKHTPEFDATGPANCELCHTQQLKLGVVKGARLETNIA